MRVAWRTRVRTSRCLSLLAPLVVVLGSGCASTGGGGGEPVDQGSEAVTENANDKIAFDYFLARGLSPVQCAGIVGNLDQESGMDPTIEYGGGPGRGIAQWSAGGRWDTTPNANVIWYGGQENESYWSLNLQLEFIWWELTHEGYGYTELKAATTIDAAVEAFQDDYEICGACDSSNRIAHADQALADFGNDVVGDVWAASYVKQSWPLASAPPIQMTQYQMKTGSIDLKNTGTKTWPAGVVKFAPIPRDQASPFAASTWLATNRVSTLAADVPPGGTGHFEWDLDPQSAGDFMPYFGLVAEGVTWFADSGGPDDNVMQVNVHVAAGSPPMTTGSGGGGGAGGDAGQGGGGGAGGSSQNSGAGAGPSHGMSTGSGMTGPHHGGSGGAGGSATDDAPENVDHGGCSVPPSGAPTSPAPAIAVLALGWVAVRRRRR